MKYISTGTLLAVLGITEVRTTSAGESDIVNGIYFGIDTEDGSSQALEILCNDDHCDILLGDMAFSTCLNITGNMIGGGVGIAKGISKDSLDNFKIDLFCLKIGQLEIDIDTDVPTSTLIGDMTSLLDGGIRRDGTGFVYFKVSNSGSSSYSAIANGRYHGTDYEDGSFQALDVLCSNEGLCDITLNDPSFSTCAKVTEEFAFGGVGIASDISVDSLDNFKIELFCLMPGQLEIDIDNDLPLEDLPGGMMPLEDGIIRRSGVGFDYFRVSTSEENPYHVSNSVRSKSSEMSSSVSKEKNFNGLYAGTDTEDGSRQTLDILCKNDVCDINLFDSSFSTCAKISGLPAFNGMGVARNVSVHSFDDFDIDLFCLQPGQVKIDIENDSPSSAISGDMILLQDGVIRRTGKEFTYMNVYTGDVVAEHVDSSKYSIDSGFYQGIETESGKRQILTVHCNDSICDIILTDTAGTICAELTGGIFFTSVGVAKNIPKDSLDDFDINIFCVLPDMLVIDIDVDSPSATIKGNFVSLDFDGIIRNTVTDDIFFKASAE